MPSISYKPSDSILEWIFGLIGPVIIAASIFFPIEHMRIQNFRLDLPPGVANALLMALGVVITFMTVHALLRKRAARSHGARIVLGEDSMTFTLVRGYAGVLTTVRYADISKVTITSNDDDDVVEIVGTVSAHPVKAKFDAVNMETIDDFTALVDVLKRRAVTATFKIKGAKR